MKHQSSSAFTPSDGLHNKTVDQNKKLMCTDAKEEEEAHPFQNSKFVYIRFTWWFNNDEHEFLEKSPIHHVQYLTVSRVSPAS